MNLKDVVLQDLWLHLAGAIAIGFGLVDLWYFHSLSHDSDLLFVVGGFAGMGLKIVNGSAAALRDVALTTALQAAQAATAIAAGVTSNAPGGNTTTTTTTTTNPPTSTGG